MTKKKSNKKSTPDAAMQKRLRSQRLSTNKKIDGNESISMTRNEFNGIVRNVTTMTRSATFSNYLNPGIDLNHECRYPDVITIKDYKDLYKRNGTANRVVKIYPEESWAINPEIIENENPEATEFEKKWEEVVKETRAYHYLKRVDILSGIGDFGVLLIGINDGKPLNEPVEGINLLTGEKTGEKEHKIIYLKPFDQAAVSIDKKETESTSPRFGMPTMYSIEFSTDDDTADRVSNINNKIHWTRIVHIADNRESSEVNGVPRMQPVYNRLLDLRKIHGGSGEMFWKGAFQGLSFETQTESDGLTDAAIESLKDQMEKYGNGMQRYLATEGLNVKTLAPTLSSPKEHIEANMRGIAISLGVPYRIFLGTEEAKLASTQDTKTWNKRLASRQNNYVSPYVIRTFIDRLIVLGVLPEIEYLVVWPDLNTPSDLDIAEVADKLTAALAKYVAGGVNAMIPEKEYLTIFLKRTPEEADAILKNAVGLQNLDDTDPIEEDDDE